MRRIAAVAVVVGLAGCAVTSGVRTEQARQVVLPPPTEPSTTAPVTPPPTNPTVPAPPSTAPPVTEPPATEPPSTTDGPPGTVPPGSVPPELADILDPGDAKPRRPYDDFVLATLVDLQLWWGENFPAVFGEPFEPLQGAVYPAYPQRADGIPGCGGAKETTYEEVSEFGAFYCAEGDFMVYDDGEDGILFTLADEFGQSVLGVVLAHEFGHAIQARTGVLARNVPTVVTEQQADCFAGAWVRRAVDGEATGLTMGDEDIRTGLTAMIAVRDPVGTDPFAPGGHGSAFDRVGAFQVGFTDGLKRCARLIDDPLPLVPTSFRLGDTDGNADYGFGDGQIVSIIRDDLNDFWSQVATVVVPQLSVVAVDSADGLTCPDALGSPATGAVYCPGAAQVLFDESTGFDLYQRFGDFSIGYVLGGAWSEAVQHTAGSQLVGEERALLDDCLVGAWVADIVPGPDGTTPRGAAEIEPGDLDEAIQAALVVGDDRSEDDVLGSAFEKIASFRVGVLEGLDACAALPD